MSNKSSNIPLEWVSTVRLANTVLAAEEIPLSLDDDELAEIIMIESNISFNFATDDIDVDTDNEAALALSMDPSVGVSQAPTTENFREDLETFYWHMFKLVSEATGTATSAQTVPANNRQVIAFPPGYGILLATNPSLIVSVNAGSSPSEDYGVTIYFKRRKAKKEELLRTLLKRR